MYYVYRFLNKELEVIYVGLTRDLDRRIFDQHFSEKGHLPPICYQETNRVEFISFKKEVDMLIYEIYFINKYKPKYNRRDKTSEKPSIQLPSVEWKWLRGFQKRRREEEKLRLEIKKSKDIYEVLKFFRDACREIDEIIEMSEKSFYRLSEESDKDKRDFFKETFIKNLGRKRENIDRILNFDIPIIY